MDWSGNMSKEKWKTIRDFIIKNCKIVFPVLVVVVAAVTVVIALNANKTKTEEQVSVEQSSEVIPQEGETVEIRPSAEEVPLAANENEAIYTLVATYYNAIGTGDTDTLQSICQGINENILLYYSELSNYIDHYADIDIYSKQGPVDGSTIVYVCTDDNGQLYIKDASIFTDEETEYIRTANEQVDVVEFNNRINVEYSELLSQNPNLLEYVGLLSTQLKTKVGEILSSRIQGTEGESGESTEEQPVSEEGTDQTQQPETPVDAGPQYATATTTVNVRSSDSERADKLGKVTNGTRVQVQEVRVNGWTKIVFEGKDGYIKSEYLQLEESAAGFDTIGTVTATTNINVRSAASETAERLGVLAGGSTLDLIANENGWCKVKYNGQVGYVKSEYVTQQ